MILKCQQCQCPFVASSLILFNCKGKNMEENKWYLICLIKNDGEYSVFLLSKQNCNGNCITQLCQLVKRLTILLSWSEISVFKYPTFGHSHVCQSSLKSHIDKTETFWTLFSHCKHIRSSVTHVSQLK